MSEKDFSDHVLYVSGQKNNAGNRTGARCVVDVLLAAGLLQEADGKLNVAIAIQDPEISTPATIVQPLVDGQIAPTIQPPVAPVTASLPPIATSITPQIAINIQLHLPETENAEVYEKLFKALKEHLLPKA